MMEFDRESEFNRLIDECKPLSIPHEYVREFTVRMENGTELTLKGEDLLRPLPLSSAIPSIGFKHGNATVHDIDVLVDIPLVQKTVVTTVAALLGAHFEH